MIKRGQPMGTVKPDFEPLPTAAELAILEIRADARMRQAHLCALFSGLADQMKQFAESVQPAVAQLEKFNQAISQPRRGAPARRQILAWRRPRRAASH